jgi:phosphomannomutase
MPLDGSGWRILTGNEIGVLLGHWQIKRWNEATKNNAVFRVPHAGKPAVLASVVSSRMLKAIAEAEGILYFDTLTGDVPFHCFCRSIR